MRTPLPAKTITQLSQLRYIGVLFTGYDRVDLEAARQCDIVVTNVPSYGTASVAQLTFRFLLELGHHVALHSEAVYSGEWSHSQDFSFWKTPLVELEGKTIRFGKIGRHVAEIAVSLGVRVVASDAVKNDTPDLADFGSCELDQLLGLRT